MIDKIQEMWDKDCIIDKTELTRELLNLNSIQHKYRKLREFCRQSLRAARERQDWLIKEKFECYTIGATNEQRKLGWYIPQKTILKGDLHIYMNADVEIQEGQRKIESWESCIRELDAIGKDLNTRSFVINSIISWEKYKVGLN